MTNLSNMLWKIDNLRITLFYDKDMRSISLENDKKSNLERLLDIPAEFVVNEKNSGRIFEVGNYDHDLKIEFNCQQNLIDFRIIGLNDNDLNVNEIISVYDLFLNKISQTFVNLDVLNIIRVALGVELKQELTNDQTIEVSKKILSISNIENYSEIQLRFNKFSKVNDSINDFRLNQIVEIEKSHAIISNIPSSSFLPLPVTAIKDICLLKLDVNTDPHNTLKINNIKDFIWELNKSISMILNEGLK